MASKLTETINVEATVAGWLEKMGWTFKSSEDLKAYQRPITVAYIKEILEEKVLSINSIEKETAEQAIYTLNSCGLTSHIEMNRDFIEKLQHGITVQEKGENKTIQFIDYNNIWNNSFIITRQYIVKDGDEIRPDIVLLVNGIPLIAIEAKQCARKGTNWLEGVKQFALYEPKALNFYCCNLFGVACNGRIAKYGVPGASSTYFNEWKDTTIDNTFDNPILEPTNDLVETYIDEKDSLPHFKVATMSNGDILEKMKMTIIGLLQPARVLDILKYFVVYEKDQTSGNIIKKVARYQQLRAANKITSRVVDSKLESGVVWHTQGSGKSLTIIFTAQKLCMQSELNDPTIYIVIDRKELKDQLGDNFEDCDFGNARRITSINDLKSIIDNKPAGIYVTTIQKFQELGDRIDDRENVVVLIDEAHRTEYGDYQMELQHCLPNAKRFAFTGTPIPKTHKEFGVVKEGKFENYIDKYSTKDAIEDEATVPIKYTLGPIEYQLDKEKLKQGYDEITADLDEDERKQVEQQVQPWKTFLKTPERIAILAKDIAEDFKAKLEPLGYKAQVVGCDKEACVLYYNELLKYFDKSELQIIFSKGNYEDVEKYKMCSPFYIEDTEKKKYVKQFKNKITEEEIKKGNNLKIFIVCNMLLTGFDAPIEQTMYLDSPIRDHNLLQAVARTNRPYVDKKSGITKLFGRIVDYVGVYQNYHDALNYDPDDIEEYEDTETYAKKFPEILETAFEHFTDIKLEDTYECTMALLNRLSELDHAKWETEFHNVVQFWEAISPDPFLWDYRDKYLWLCNIYELYLEEFKRSDFDASEYAAKTRKLLQESVSLLNFRGHLPEITIDADYLNKLKETKLSPADKAEKIIRDIQTMIRMNSSYSYVYVEFQERLDDLIRRKQEELDGIETILIQLGQLFTEVDDVISLPKKMGFDDMGSFEIFTLIKNQKEGLEESLICDYAKACKEKIDSLIFTGWHDMPNKAKEITTSLKLLSAAPDYEEMQLFEDENLFNQIQVILLKYYKVN